MFGCTQAINIIEGKTATSSDFLFEEKHQLLIFLNYLVLLSAKYA